MKPVIITIMPDSNGRVRLTVKELQEMLDKAYNAGKADGSSVHYDCPNRWWWSNSSPYYTNDHVTITCNGNDSNAILNPQPVKLDQFTYGTPDATTTTMSASTIKS